MFLLGQSKAESPSSSPVMNAPELLSRHFAVICTEKQAKVGQGSVTDPAQLRNVYLTKFVIQLDL